MAPAGFSPPHRVPCSLFFIQNLSHHLYFIKKCTNIQVHQRCLSVFLKTNTQNYKSSPPDARSKNNFYNKAIARAAALTPSMRHGVPARRHHRMQRSSAHRLWITLHARMWTNFPTRLNSLFHLSTAACIQQSVHKDLLIENIFSINKSHTSRDFPQGFSRSAWIDPGGIPSTDRFTIHNL